VKTKCGKEEKVRKEWKGTTKKEKEEKVKEKRRRICTLRKHESRKVIKTKEDKECAGNDKGLSW
jgi:hypothetical protein